MQMKYLRLLLLATCVTHGVCAQRTYVGFFGGVASYGGDLASGIFPKKATHPGLGISASYEINAHMSFRAQFNWGILGADDKYSNDPTHSTRNLSFKTNLYEFALAGEYYLLDIDRFGFSPYAFGGGTIFRFNPYAFDSKGKKIFLKPLSTEGQGLSAYPDRKTYSLFQPTLAFGGGVKFRVNDQMRVGFELSMRKLFFEYLDDVSTDYVDWELLRSERGDKAVEMAYRGDELVLGPNNSIIPYPATGTQRGDPTNEDNYYFSGLSLTYFFNSVENSKRRQSKTYGIRKGRIGCPTLY